jgi:hypothetical protein
MDLLKKLRSSKYQKLDDLEAVKNREDKSTLIIHSLFPERFLNEEIAHPDEVKRLAIYLSFDNYEGSSCGCKRNRQGNNICKDCFLWENKYTDTLCSGLTKFHKLETLCVVDLDLSCDLWIEFAQNCTCLKEIYFDSSKGACSNDSDIFWWDNEKKNAALDALFQIPTLEKVCISNILLPYFPPGPSNIKHLELKRVQLDYFETEEYKKEVYEIYSKNLHTHTNLKTLRLIKGNDIPFNILDLQFDKMLQLQELFLAFEDDVKEKIVSLLPNLKKFHSNFSTKDKQKLANSLKLICSLNSNIEEIGINVDSWENKDQLKEELRVFSAECKSLEKLEIVFVNYM